jgi:hypothetical protein
MANEIKIPDELITSTMQGVIDLFLKPKFISLGMNATGKWLNSLEARAVNGNGEIWGMDYTYWLVNGRKGGTAPPISALLPWVTAKFGIGGNEAKSIAFAVAAKIKKEGTNYYPEGTDLLEVLNSKEVLDYIYSQLQEGVTIEINKILKKQLYDNFA